MLTVCFFSSGRRFKVMYFDNKNFLVLRSNNSHLRWKAELLLVKVLTLSLQQNKIAILSSESMRYFAANNSFYITLHFIGS